MSCLHCGVPAQCRTGPRARTQGLLPLLQAVVSRNVPALFAATSLRLVGDSILKLCSMLNGYKRALCHKVSDHFCEAQCCVWAWVAQLLLWAALLLLQYTFSIS